MVIDMAAFTPWSALIGGLLVGLASAILLLFSGRIAGISGIVGRLLPWNSGESPWRLAFIIGLLAGPIIWVGFAEFPPVDVQATNLQVIAAGLLVGFGTRLGSGCTSGHGVCGLSRLSLRSLVATCSFIAAGVVTVYITHHIL